VDVDERVRVVAVIEQERRDVFAMSAAADRAGTRRRGDGVAVERDLDAIRLLPPAEALDALALGPQVAPDVVPQIGFGLIQTGLADLAANLRPGELRDFDHRAPSPCGCRSGRLVT